MHHDQSIWSIRVIQSTDPTLFRVSGMLNVTVTAKRQAPWYGSQSTHTVLNHSDNTLITLSCPSRSMAMCFIHTCTVYVLASLTHPLTIVLPSQSVPH